MNILSVLSIDGILADLSKQSNQILNAKEIEVSFSISIKHCSGGDLLFCSRISIVYSSFIVHIVYSSFIVHVTVWLFKIDSPNAIDSNLNTSQFNRTFKLIAPYSG